MFPCYIIHVWGVWEGLGFDTGKEFISKYNKIQTQKQE